jgi:hypothetical protein
VDQADRVGGLERACELLDDCDCDWGRQPALGADHRLQVAAGDVAHRDVVDAVDLPGVVDREDVRMVEARGERRLLQEDTWTTANYEPLIAPSANTESGDTKL